MSYTLTPGRFLRHLAIAYRKNGGIEIPADNERMRLKKQLGLIEKRFSEAIIDEEASLRISRRISELKSRL